VRRCAAIHAGPQRSERETLLIQQHGRRVPGAAAHARGVPRRANVFEHVLGHQTGPHGGRWWTTGHDDSAGHRTVLLVRRRRGVSGRAFRAFLQTHLGPALHAAGARDLRTYALVPFAALAHITFGVSHRNPPHRRYHGAVIFGTGTRARVDDLIASPEVSAAIGDQHLTCTAVHAFAVDRTLPVIRMKDRTHVEN
jgi:hypothetical protein